MNRLCICLVLSTVFFLTGCVEKNGYYTEGENNVISLVCDVTWSTENTIHDAGEKHPGKSISSKGTALVHVPSFGPTRMGRNPEQKFITGGLFMIRVPVRFISVRAIIGILKNLLPRSSQFITGLENMEVWICPGNTWNCPL